MPNGSENKVFVDSNILVYAFQPHTPQYPVVIDLLDRLVRLRIAAISIQNLAEFSNVVLAISPNTKPFERIKYFTQNLEEVFFCVAYSARTVIAAQKIVETTGTGYYDALLAATMLENEITTIYTENVKDFERIPGIKTVNPFE